MATTLPIGIPKRAAVFQEAKDEMVGFRRGLYKQKKRLIKTQRAFTLVELILVVLVLSVIAGLTAPNLSKSLTKHQFEKSADELHNMMRYAQSRAISKGQPVRLIFNEDLKSYWLADAADKTEADAFERFSGRMGQTRRIPPDVLIDLGALQGVTFNVDGSMEKCAISVCQKSRCKVISTRIQRGFIRVYESEGLP